MGDWPNIIGYNKSVKYPTFVDGTGPYITSITSSTSNTKGSWIEIESSTDFDACAIMIQFPYSADNENLIDIGIGAASSEEVIIENLMFTANPQVQYREMNFFFPIFIPAGTRLSSRAQAASGGASLHVAIIIFGGGLQTQSFGQTVKSYGYNETNSMGTEIDPGVTANTKGSWVEITSATTHEIRGFCCGFNNNAMGVRQDAKYWNVDVAIGAAASEKIILENFLLTCDSDNDFITPQSSPFFNLTIPEGERIAVRAASNETDSSDRLFDFALYGVT